MGSFDLRRIILCGVAFGVMTACATVLGLDSFEKVDSLATDGGGGNDGGVLQLPTGTLPATWTRWPVTEQVQGVSGQYDGQEGVVDKKTNLVWRKLIFSAQSFDEAVGDCDSLQPIHRWRLPSRVELISLLDFTQPDRLDATHFDGPGRLYWTASAVRPIGARLQYWAVSFQGQTQVLQKLDANGTNSLPYVRCVETQ
jgi:hypothetical protein